MKSLLPSIFFFLLPIIVMGCNGNAEKERLREDSIRRADSIAAVQRQANDLTSDAFAYADSVLSTLTLSQKAAMTLMPAVYARNNPANIQKIMEYARDMGVGGFVMLKGDLASMWEIADTLQSLSGPGLFLSVDAENGLRMRFPDAPEFPWNRELGRLTDDQVMYEFGNELARECRLVGLNMVLGPVIDIVPGEGSHGLMRKRSLGSDPRRVAELAVAYSRGVEDGNVISVAKHFPGHGSANADSHKALGEIKSDRQALDSIDLYPFNLYAKERLSGIMVGHLYVEALDSIRRPAVASPVIINDILRNQIGFKGLVLTDALNMEGALGVSAWQALNAGADIILAPNDTKKEITGIINAVRDGKLPEKTLNERCRNILFYKYLIRDSDQYRAHTAIDAVDGINNLDPEITGNIKNLRFASSN